MSADKQNILMISEFGRDIDIITYLLENQGYNMIHLKPQENLMVKQIKKKWI